MLKKRFDIDFEYRLHSSGQSVSASRIPIQQVKHRLVPVVAADVPPPITGMD